MATSAYWTRQQLLVAFGLYCQMPFGKMHSRNPDVVKYASLIGRTPSALAMKLTNIASLDPAITSTGRVGLKGASSADKAMWEEMNGDWESFAQESQRALNALDEITDAPSSTIDLVKEDAVDYTGRSKEVQTLVRIGQDFFRRSVLSAYNYRCCISGLAIPQLLIASHIVPWKSDTSNRINPRNGLCLSSLHDKAFDIGIITVTQELTISVSPKYTASNDPFFAASILAYEGQPIALPEKFAPLEEFLSFHRQNIFQR